MKRFKREELLAIIETLAEANDYIGKNIGANEEILLDILSQCQEAAINVGNCIETYGEIGEPLIRILEDYCENIYQISQNLRDDKQRRKLVKKIQKQLVTLKNSTYYEFPVDKKEIVFLPYTASMWDSLESVWKAASEDENCEVYVVPIPYFDKNPNGTLGQEHYEGHEFPAYVPITSWEDYRIEERRPDIIYIHNPYDQYNYVTSVHPDFYAKKLRKYTNMLVYIPYFVAIDDKVAEHFCILPGVFYANKVIVQSEKVRQTYIGTLRAYEEENNCKGVLGDLEEKVIALGSPKYDKVRTAKKEDYDMPKEWKKLIYKADESKKKVVLYNTTIDQMLKKSNTMIEKIEDTFKRFEYDEETVLLWRPHPLLKSTLKSMRPELLQKYEAMENNYVEKGFGIYDTSEDLYRAITFSDIYYGDWSSVAELYKDTGKPIMIQNDELQMKISTESQLIFECISQYEDYYLATSMEYNGLFSISKDGKATFISMIPNEEIGKKHLYMGSAIYKDYLILAPCTADKICIYNIKTKAFQFKEVKALLQKQEQTMNNKFLGVEIYNDAIFLLPQQYPYIIKMSPLTWEMEYIALNSENEKINLKKGYCRKEHLLLMPSVSEHMLLELDMNTNSVKKRYIHNESGGIWSICNNGDDDWMIAYPSSEIVCVNDKDGNVEVLKDYPEQLKKNGYGFAMSFTNGEDYYACPVKANMMLKVNMNTKQVLPVHVDGLTKANKILMYLDRIENHYIFYRYDQDDTIWSKAGEYIILDTSNLSIKQLRVEIDNVNELEKVMFSREFEERRVLKERFISYSKLLFEKEYRTNKPIEIGLSGINIYKQIKDMI